jgi:sugar phosphate isomerase/epimerase
MDGDLEKRQAAVVHLKKVIAASAKLGVNRVTTFVGRDQTRSVEDNLELFKSSGRRSCLCRAAGRQVAIENCPMLFGRNSGPRAEPGHLPAHLAQAVGDHPQ